MTGGQSHEDNIALQIIKELKAVGVKQVVGVYDKKEIFNLSGYNSETEMV